MRDATEFPIIIGVTGHRDIHPDAMPCLRTVVHSVLDEWRTRFGDALHVLTALADGADQLVADVARCVGVPIIAVLPMPRETYRELVTNRANLDAHWRDAVLRTELSDVEPAYVSGYLDRQFEQLGLLLARRSHLLLALWDGRPDPDNHAGTASVVRARLHNDERAKILGGSQLFSGAASQLRLVNPGPLLHILTPRQGEPLDPPERKVGDCLLFDIRGPWRQKSEILDQVDMASRPVSATDSYASLNPRTLRDFNQIIQLNAQIASFGGPDRSLFQAQVNEFPTDKLPADVKGGADWLGRLQAAADTAAQKYQGRLMGHFVPARSLTHMVTKSSARWDSGRMPRPGAVFLLTAAVPAAVLFFELYAHLHGGLIFFSLYVAALLGSSYYYQHALSDHEMQNRFQDYRALAEAMRVQLFWGMSAISSAVSDHYLGKQFGELGWIQLALRGPAVWATAMAEQLSGPQRQLVTANWIHHQLNYFKNSTQLHESVAHRSREWLRLLLILAVVASLTLLCLEASCFHNKLCKLADENSPGYWVREILRVVVVTSPVIGGAFSVSGELRAYEPHARSYALMRWIFARAAGEVEKIEKSATEHMKDKAFQRLARELGREALAENAEWLVDHRYRTVKNELVAETEQAEDD